MGPSVNLVRDDQDATRKELLVERRLSDYLARHDGPIDEIEQAALRARIRRSIERSGVEAGSNRGASR